MVIIDSYLDYHNKYIKIYGSKTIILMQVGSFFEVYATLTEGPNMKEISELLDIQYTKKDKGISEVNKSNHYLLGFPLYTLQKFTDILINNQYTIVLIEQVTLPPKPERKVTQIISSSTYTDYQKTGCNNNYLMSIYFTTSFDKFKNPFINISISWLDVSTNECFIYEINDFDTQINLEDTLKTILNNNPNEIVLFTDLQTKSIPKHMDLISNFILQLQSNICIHDRTKSTIHDNFFKLSYQTITLKKVYPNTGLLSVIEYLDLEMKHNIIVSFVYLLNFAYEHNEKILNGMKKPIYLENDKYLSLINNALVNLNIISSSSSKTSSVINLLNNCKTTIGKRYFKKCLINPLTNSKLIEERYNQCDFFIKDKFYDCVRKFLSNISDFERLQKRIIMKTLQPPELFAIYNSFICVKNLYIVMKEKNANFNLYGWNDNLDNLDNIINYFERFDFNELEKVNLNQIIKNLFKKNIYNDLDFLQNEINTLENIFESIVDCLNDGCSQPEFKLEKNKDNMKSISVTSNRYQNMIKDKNRINKINIFLKDKYLLSIDDISSKPLSANNKNMLKIVFKGMNENQTKLSELQSEFRNKITNYYLSELDFISNSFSNLFTSVIEFVSKIDIYSNNAFNSCELSLRRPEIINEPFGFIKANKIRHILIENIHSDIPYIANDIHIGSNDEKGMILYGYNGVGKSSLLKSIGISLILAQSGCFVPCDNFIFSPYYKLFSRIPGSDNLFKGQSLFQAEISELRTILKRSDCKSLVISDELCSGTENLSAISLISSSIKFLSDNNVSFLMATHLHELTDINCVKNAINVHVYHLEVSYNDKYGLIYDRILKKGQGIKEYGLEVCKSLNLPDDFLLTANKIRQEIIGLDKNIVSMKNSKYNSAIFFDKCCICNNKTDEIHHINEQHKSNEIGIIDNLNIHKNRKSNLMNVCSSCHDEIHNNIIKINGFIQTTNGIKLDLVQKTNNLVNVDEKIKELRYDGKSFTQILDIIKQNHDPNITLYRIKKIFK